MKFAYADPPYPGCAHLFPEQREVNHRDLVTRLMSDNLDGWALSTSSVALRDMLVLCPPGVRVAAWVKPFASFKPGVNPAYAWEPVIWIGGRARSRKEPTVRDWVSANVTLKKGLTGAKPDEFCFWVFQLLGMRPGDELEDLFPGTGRVMRAWEKYQRSFPGLAAPALEEP